MVKRLLDRLHDWVFRPIAGQDTEPAVDPVDPYLLALLAGGTIDIDALTADIEDNTANFYIQEDLLSEDD